MVKFGSFGRGSPNPKASSTVISTKIDDDFDSSPSPRQRAEQLVQRKIAGKRIVLSFEPPEVQRIYKQLVEEPENRRLLDARVGKSFLTRTDVERHLAKSGNVIGQTEDGRFIVRNPDGSTSKVNLQVSPTNVKAIERSLKRNPDAVGLSTTGQLILKDGTRQNVPGLTFQQITNKQRTFSPGRVVEIGEDPRGDELVFRQFDDDIAQAASLDDRDEFGGRVVTSGEGSFKRFIKDKEPIRGTIEFGLEKIRSKLAKIGERQGGQNAFAGDTGTILTQAAEIGLFANPVTGPFLITTSGVSQVITPGGRTETQKISDSISSYTNIDSKLIKTGLNIFSLAAATIGGVQLGKQISALTPTKTGSVFLSRDAVASQDRVLSRSSLLIRQKNLFSERKIIAAVDTDLRFASSSFDDITFKAASRGVSRESKGFDLITRKEAYSFPKPFGAVSSGTLQKVPNIELNLGSSKLLSVSKQLDDPFISKVITQVRRKDKFDRIFKINKISSGISFKEGKGSGFIGQSFDLNLLGRVLKRTKISQVGTSIRADSSIFNKNIFFTPNILKKSPLSLQQISKVEALKNANFHISQIVAEASLSKPALTSLTKNLGTISRSVSSGVSSLISSIKPVKVEPFRSSGVSVQKLVTKNVQSIKPINLNVQRSFSSTGLRGTSLTKQISRVVQANASTPVLKNLLRQASLQRQPLRQKSVSRQRALFRTPGFRIFPQSPKRTPGFKFKKSRGLSRPRQSRRGIDSLFIVPSFTARVSGASIRIPKAKLPKIATKLQGIGLRPQVFFTSRKKRR